MSPCRIVWIFVHCLWFLLTLSSLYAQSSKTTPDSLNIVQQVVELYEAGQISEAERIALKAIEAQDGFSRYDKFELYRVLAFCAIANDDETNGIRYFIQALRLNPNLSPDPITWSPKVRRVFEQARAEYLKISTEETRQRVAAEAELCRKASLKSLYLPGLGQYEKEQPLKGAIYGAVFALSAAVFIYAEVNLPKARERYRDAQLWQDINREYKNYRKFYRLERISGAMLVISYTVPFLDALWWKPGKNTSEEN